MPRELRSRKTVSETKNGETQSKVVEKTEVKGKRKAATENESPIPKKLQKGTKKAIAKDDTEKPAIVKKTTTKTTKKPAAPVVEEPPVDLEAESSSDSEGEEEIQAAAEKLDPEAETPPAPTELYKPGQAVGVIPDVSQAVEKAAKSKTDGEPGVIYIGRIPHGFYEHEMRQYFAQFGEIRRLRLSRNKKTGASKHIAFVEFAESSTADIVAKTMNNYLLFGHILKCQRIPKEAVNEAWFKGANRRFKKIPFNKMQGKQLEKPHAASTWEKKIANEEAKRAKKAAALKAMGYDFTAPEIKEIPPPTPAPEVVEEVKTIEAAPEDDEDVEEEEVKVVTKKAKKNAPAKSISAPKTNVTKVTKSKKAKA